MKQQHFLGQYKYTVNKKGRSIRIRIETAYNSEKKDLGYIIKKEDPLE